VTNEIIITLELRRSGAHWGPRYVADTTLAIYENGSIHPGRTPIATFTARSDTSGTVIFQVAGGLDGYYDLVVKPNGAVSRERNSVRFFRGIAKSLTMGPFDEGDADGDDDVDATDLAILIPSYTRFAGHPGYDARADFNRDGTVSLLDFSLLAPTYHLAGPIQQR
jgi:hypothetical protein